MKNSSTIEDIRRLSFVENLYKQLRSQTQSAIDDHNRMVLKATAYLDDGLSSSECSELLVIDGVSRESAESYAQLAQSCQNLPLSGRNEYCFQFEDVYGKTWSSYDINHAVFASSDEEAWERAEEAIFADPSIEPEKIVSIDRIA